MSKNKSKINRRESLKYLGVSSLSAGLILTGCDPKPEQQEAHQHKAADTGTSDRDKELLSQRFFTDEERKTVRVLADMIIPADERSGNASDAKVPEFIEFMMLDQPYRQTPMRGGLAWLNLQAMKRFEKGFADCEEAQRKEIVDEIAWPAKARPEMRQGVAFFNNFRDLTAIGFWTSRIGIDDLQYLGNVGVPEWKGCPEEALQQFGVSYAEYEKGRPTG
jgi:gluconate 2-dehydrogenase gamma chain